MSQRLLVFLCLSAACYAADKLVGGPYVVNSAPRSATIGWVVETDSVQTSAPGEPKRRIPVLRSDKISVTGLKAGETIEYEIPGAAPLDERRGSFRVAPAGPAPFEFVVFGDTRTRHELHRKIVGAIVGKTSPDFVLHTGDLVADGYDTEQWPRFFDIERQLLKKTVFFPVLGNHERNNPRFHEFFDVHTPYYSFNWGNAHFSLIDSDIGNFALGTLARQQFWDAQMGWLEEDLAANQKADYRFVVMHHPPVTVNLASAGHVSKEAAAMRSLLEKGKVTAVLAGHDHNYQHHLINGVHYVVTGGGGAPLAKAEPSLPDITLKVESIEHFVTVRVEGQSARVDAIALDGRLIERIVCPPGPR